WGAAKHCFGSHSATRERLLQGGSIFPAVNDWYPEIYSSFASGRVRPEPVIHSRLDSISRCHVNIALSHAEGPPAQLIPGAYNGVYKGRMVWARWPVRAAAFDRTRGAIQRGAHSSSLRQRGRCSRGSRRCARSRSRNPPSWAG